MTNQEDSHDHGANRHRSRRHDGQTRDSRDAITVELILRKLAEGATEADLLEAILT
ncbi:MAG TPA: hypothetical protein VFN26_12310 [Candidatus Acidoferrum sp.]|nr:hypothetical protein [Candidatus Acidoferrum sp.]